MGYLGVVMAWQRERSIHQGLAFRGNGFFWFSFGVFFYSLAWHIIGWLAGSYIFFSGCSGEKGYHSRRLSSLSFFYGRVKFAECKQTRLHWEQQKHIYTHKHNLPSTRRCGEELVFPGNRQTLSSDVKRVIAVFESFIYLFRFDIWTGELLSALGFFFLLLFFFFFFFSHLSHSLREIAR